MNDSEVAWVAGVAWMRARWSKSRETVFVTVPTGQMQDIVTFRDV